MSRVAENNEQRFRYLDCILPRGCDDLSTIKLQPGNCMIILEGVKHSTTPEIPDLVGGVINRMIRRWENGSYPQRLV